MLDIGIQELLVIMVLALLIFGPDKLPDLGRRLGRAMREFRRASDEFRSTVEQNLRINEDISPASPSPLEPAAATSAASPPEAHAVGADGQSAGVSAVEPVGSGAGVAEGQAGEDLLEPYWTSRGGRLLHRRECAWRARVAASERIPLKAALDGWEQGLKPCPVCDPKEAAVAS